MTSFYWPLITLGLIVFLIVAARWLSSAFRACDGLARLSGRTRRR